MFEESVEVVAGMLPVEPVEIAIAFIPEEVCTARGAVLNEVAASLLPYENAPNNWHVTIYHGAYDPSEIPEIAAGLSALLAERGERFDMDFKPGLIARCGRWVDWDIKKPAELEALHSAVVDFASPYHHGQLRRIADVYESLSEADKAQADEYGVSGLKEFYNPHMTLFYKDARDYNADTAITDAVDEMNARGLVPEASVYHVSKIAIGELGRNGNITKVLHTINLK